MTTFDKREQAFESQLAHDEDVRFRAIARRDKWFGLWAAGKLGKTGADAEAYASALVKVHVNEGGEKAFDQVRADFNAAGVNLSDHQLHRKLEELLATAIADIKSGKSGH